MDVDGGVHIHSSFEFVSCLQVLTSIHHDRDINTSDFLQKKLPLELPKTCHANNVCICLSYPTIFSSNTSHTAPKSSNDPYTCSIICLSSHLWIRWLHPSPWVDIVRHPNNLIWHQLFLLLCISPHQAPKACMALCLSNLSCLVPF
jgi:hypothetical protein